MVCRWNKWRLRRFIILLASKLDAIWFYAHLVLEFDNLNIWNHRSLTWWPAMETFFRWSYKLSKFSGWPCAIIPLAGSLQKLGDEKKRHWEGIDCDAWLIALMDKLSKHMAPLFRIIYSKLFMVRVVNKMLRSSWVQAQKTTIKHCLRPHYKLSP